MTVLCVILQYNHDANKAKDFEARLVPTLHSDLEALGRFPHPRVKKTLWNAPNARVTFKWANPSDVGVHLTPEAGRMNIYRL